MEKKVRRPIVYVVLAGLLALAAYFFRDKLFQTDGKNPDVNDQPDLENPEIKLPERFKWEQYVSKDPKLMLPVRMPLKQAGVPLRIDADCVVFEGRLQPVIHVTYLSNRERADIRVDATLLYQGFEQDRYTVVYPIQERQRFMLKAQSAFMADTASISVLGAAQFPVMTAYRIEEAAIPIPGNDIPGLIPRVDPKIDPKVGAPRAGDPQAGGLAAKQYRHHFQLGELANGTAYHIRVCEFIDNVWVATEEAAITTPFCPNDENLSQR